MNRSLEEQKMLDEKIALIRKKNEEIIRRKKLVDDEIKSAQQDNAIINTKKAYNVDESVPTLYSDTISLNHPTKSIVYPKVEVKKNAIRRHENEDAAWRQEREKIDNDRIRRQKADTGWRREWDADKSFNENQRTNDESGPKDSYRPAGQKTNYDDRRDNRNFREDATKKNSNDNMSWENHYSRFSHEDNSRDNLKSRINYDDGNQKSNFSPAHHQVSQSWRSKLDQRENAKNTGNSEVWTKKSEIRSTNNEWEEGTKAQQVNVPTKSSVRSALNIIQKRIVNAPSNVGASNIVNYKVTEYSKTKAKPPSLDDSLMWMNEKSKSKESSLNDRLKNIVIHVNNKKTDSATRVVEIMNESKSESGIDNETSSGVIKSHTFENSYSKNFDAMDTRVMEPVKSQTFCNLTNPPAPSESIKFSFGTSFPSNRVLQRSEKSLVGILKKSPESSPTHEQDGNFNFEIQLPSGTSKEETKKQSDETVKSSPEGIPPRVKFSKGMPKKEDLNVVDASDEEWEDVSDEDWTDASDDE